MAKIKKDNTIDPRESETIDKVKYSNPSAFIGQIFSYILFGLLLVVLVRALTDSSFDVTLGGFLEYISNVPDVSLSWLSGIDLTIVADWGVFEFLRLFINAISSVLEIALMLVGGIAQLVAYIGYIITYIFL